MSDYISAIFIKILIWFTTNVCTDSFSAQKGGQNSVDTSTACTMTSLVVMLQHRGIQGGFPSTLSPISLALLIEYSCDLVVM